MFSKHDSEATAWDSQANSLVKDLAEGCAKTSLCSVTVAIYDTAWVSMLRKDIDGKTEWLFPETFRFILDNQLPDGGWGSDSSTGDGILNTMAALLALKIHEDVLKSDCGNELDGLRERSSRAQACLQSLLQIWDVETESHVGFEILVPALLDMIERKGLYFTFPGKEALLALHSFKSKEFNPEILYRNVQTTMLHSLEAFIGKIDFDRISHHKRFGSMMGSPASTAAYLMHHSSWDTEAEQYIRRVIADGSGKGTGAVPSVYPTAIFEIVWVIPTLLRAGYHAANLGQEELEGIVSYLERHLENQKGVCGFAPEVLEDADDTAKTILTLALRDRAVHPRLMLEHFHSPNGSFQTYVGERNGSLSANCNVLNALLECPDSVQYQDSIESISSFICEAWWTGNIQDKWNISLHYSMMLLAENLMSLLRNCNEGSLRMLPDHLLQHRIPIVLTQILTRTLLTQNANGSWGTKQYPEVTAYAVLTLSATYSLPCVEQLVQEIGSALERGRSFLTQHRKRWCEPQYIWIEKVTYGCPKLSEAYCLAAMKAKESSYSWNSSLLPLLAAAPKQASQLSGFLSTLPTFQHLSPYSLKLSAIESLMFLPLLKSAQADILPRQSMAKNEYLSFIPCTWVTVNSCCRLFLEPSLLWDMMLLTVCNFRVDECMETTVAAFSAEERRCVEAGISRLCNTENVQDSVRTERPHENLARPLYGLLDAKVTSGVHAKTVNPGLAETHATFRSYINAMLEYPSIKQASVSDKFAFRIQLQQFLLSHLRQIDHNTRFSAQGSLRAQEPATFLDPLISFYDWAHTTGAQSVSALMSFTFLTCILGAASTAYSDCFATARQKYLSQDLGARIAVMSRLYNDWGSMTRDFDEGNVNSVNFPEFHEAGLTAKASVDGPGVGIEKLKDDLLALAEYERKCVDVAAEQLEKELGTGFGTRQKVAKGFRLFTDVAKLYADIYLARDLSNAIRKKDSG
ncbi:hypothetical protein MMC13_007276 [Lambiella insularis]|nr:hypothetical protein [Lambiella insularis]